MEYEEERTNRPVSADHVTNPLLELALVHILAPAEVVTLHPLGVSHDLTHSSLALQPVVDQGRTLRWSGT